MCFIFVMQLRIKVGKLEKFTSKKLARYNVKERWPPSLGQQIKNHKCTSVTININLSYLL